MSDYPNELCQGLADIKQAIANIGSDNPVTIPDREYPDKLCEALGAIKDSIEDGSIAPSKRYIYTSTVNNAFADVGDNTPYDYEEFCELLAASKAGARILIDATSLGLGELMFPVMAVYSPGDGYIVGGSGANIVSDTNYFVGHCMWLYYLFIAEAIIYDNTGVVDMKQMIKDLPCTVSVYI